MVKGPCLCGDPYCASCGNPDQARWNDALLYFNERLERDLKDETELDIFYDAGLAAVRKYRVMGNEPPY